MDIDMENIIAYAVLVIAFLVIVAAVRYGYSIVKKNQQAEKEREAASKKFWADKLAEANKVRIPDSMRNYVNELDKDGSRVNITARSDKIVNEVPPRGKEMTKKYVSQPKPQKMEDRATPAQETRSYTSTSSDDGFLTGMLIGAAVDSLLHSSNSSASEERSVGVSKSESSWGFEDSSSRKAVEDTFSSSSSSDSWSSSSSDVSSDW